MRGERSKTKKETQNHVILRERNKNTLLKTWCEAEEEEDDEEETSRKRRMREREHEKDSREVYFETDFKVERGSEPDLTKSFRQLRTEIYKLI